MGAPGFATVADDDRISIVSPLPTIYEDAEGATAKSNPLTTDANGMVECWIVGGKYDLSVTVGSTVKLYTDVATVGGEQHRSTIYGGGTGVAHILDTLRAMVAGDVILALRSAGSNKFTVAGDGEIVAGTAGATHALTGSLSATTSMSAGTSVAASTTVTAGTGVTSTTGNVQATAGNFVGKRLVTTQGTAIVSGDFALSAGWGDTATITFGPGGRVHHGQMGVTANGAGIAANPQITFTFPDGAFDESPHYVVCRRERVAPVDAYWRIFSHSTTAVIFEFVGTPVAGSEYSLSYVGIG